MIVYSVLLFWIILCAVIPKYHFQYGNTSIMSGRILYLWVSFLAIGIIMALRSPTVGTDTLAYSHYFINISYANNIEEAANASFIPSTAFNIFLYILGKISINPQLYIFCISLIITVGMARFIYYTSDNIPISVFLFLTLNLFFIALNAGRQWVSIVLALNAFVCWWKNIKSRWGWIIFFIACSVHNATLSFLPALIGIYLVKHSYTYKKILSISILGTIILAFLFFVVSGIFIDYFPHYAMYLDDTSQDNLIENTGQGKIIMLYIMFLGIVGLYSIAAWCHRIQYNETITYAMIPGSVFCSIIGIIFSQNTMMNRILLPYQCFFLILIPTALSTFNKRMSILLYFIIGIGLLSSYYLWMYSNLGDILPYHFYFE